jgi:hypothetical protein
MVVPNVLGRGAGITEELPGKEVVMTLKDELNALKAKYDTVIPVEKQAVMHRATEELEKSGLINRVPKVGNKAPDFSLRNADGATVNLCSLLKSGPVVLSFFRGGW